MINCQKPLHVTEQALLLSALLFDSNNLSELLKFLPDEQAWRLNAAKDKFLALPRDERMTQTVLELRRLLMIEEYRLEAIHQSWIEDALKKEPAYLRTLLSYAIEIRSAKNGPGAKSQHLKFPFSLVFSIFTDSLVKAPQKTAIYDQVLIRLQSLKTEKQDDSFYSIGLSSIYAIAPHVHEQRWLSYLKKRGLHKVKPNPLGGNNDPFVDSALRQYFLHEVITFKPTHDINSIVFCGLITAALYLSCHKYAWQRAIVLGLKKPLGCLIEAIINRAHNLHINELNRMALSKLLLQGLALEA